MDKSRENLRKPRDFEARIRLIIDLPINERYGCICGNVYNVDWIHMEPGRMRMRKVEFTTNIGLPACALPGEFEWLDK